MGTMCSNYFPTLSAPRLTVFGVFPELDLGARTHAWKGYAAPMIRSSDDGRELLLGEFGLLPFWSKERKIKYSTFNARSETVETASSFKTPWAKRQRCIIPADHVVEPDWRTGEKHRHGHIQRGWLPDGSGRTVGQVDRQTHRRDRA